MSTATLELPTQHRPSPPVLSPAHDGAQHAAIDDLLTADGKTLNEETEIVPGRSRSL